MELRALLHLCNNPKCKDEPGGEADARKAGNEGYSPKFRLATLEQGRPTLYEADTNPFAKTGGDLLDIRGKVAAIDILEDDDENTLLTTIDGDPTITRFVDLALEAPVNQNDRDRRGRRYFLRFRLADGTAVVRVFRPETRELSRGIMMVPEGASIVADALQNRHQSLSGLMTPEEAKAAGLAHARFAGLVGEPTDVFAKLTTLEQYVFTSTKGTGQLGSDAASVGWHPDRKVWVVASRGQVKLAMPGSSCETYDNITLALECAHRGINWDRRVPCRRNDALPVMTRSAASTNAVSK